MNKRAVTRASAVACAIAVVVGGNAAGAAGSASVSPRGASPGRLAFRHDGPLRLGRIGLDAGGSTLLSGSPGYQPAANPKTGTLYVPILCTNPSTNATCAATSSDVVDVINSATCNATAASHCRVLAKAVAGSGALVATVDETTDTLYVGSIVANTVSVIDGATCNAGVTSGCGRPLATIKVGVSPNALALNPRTKTLYSANYIGGSPKGSVSVINVAACNAVTTKGCGQPARTVKDSLDPIGVDVDVATDTVYAVNDGPTGQGDTLSVINGATCNGSNGTGCDRTPPTTTIGSNPQFDVVDQATDTVYSANYNDGTVSVVNGATCNAKVTSGCKKASPAVITGAGTSFVSVDTSLHTLFVLNNEDDTLSEINTKTCNGTVTSGCPMRARNEQTTYNAAKGPDANSFALIPQTGTVYLVSAGGENLLSAMSVRGCNAVVTSACRVEVPSLPNHEWVMATDRATDTIYATDYVVPEIDVLNGATCDPSHLSGCAAVAEIPIGALVGAIDDATHTLYASVVTGSNAVAAIDTATCNAHDTTGCATPAPTITIGPGPGVPAINPATDTLYVPFGERGRNVAVVNAATCNADVTSGCGQRPAVVRVGVNTPDLAVSVKTDTIYAPSFTTGDTVAVINGATCNGTDHSGCGHLAATVKVGLYPFGVAVDDATQTVYVANNTNGDTPGTVSVINGATCNGSDTTGCKGTMPTIEVGRSPLAVALNARTDTLYVSDYSSAAVSVVNGSKCNAEVTTGCRQPAPQRAVGSQPYGLAVNPHNSTVYVADLLGQGAMSIFDGRP